MRVLLATDLSTAAERARDLVRSVRWPEGSQRETSGRLAAATAERLTQAGIAAKPKTREGRAAAEIVAEAEAEKADLIVIGSRGHTGVARLVLGSVARAVLTHAHCSVLIVRTQPAKPKAAPRSAEGALARA